MRRSWGRSGPRHRQRFRGPRWPSRPPKLPDQHIPPHSNDKAPQDEHPATGRQAPRPTARGGPPPPGAPAKLAPHNGRWRSLTSGNPMKVPSGVHRGLRVGLAPYRRPRAHGVPAVLCGHRQPWAESGPWGPWILRPRCGQRGARRPAIVRPPRWRWVQARASWAHVITRTAVELPGVPKPATARSAQTACGSFPSRRQRTLRIRC